MKQKKHIVKLLVFAVLAVLFYLLTRGNGFSIKESLSKSWEAVGWAGLGRICLAIFGVLALQYLILLLLSFVRTENHRVRTVLTLTANLVRYVVIIVIVIAVLSLLKVDMPTILAGLGIIALIIGFGAESLIADIVTGMFILIDNQYNIGDIIEVDGFRGTVTEINVRSTVLTDAGGNVKIINNSDMKNILNRSDNTSKAIAEFPIPYEVNLVELEEKLPAMLQEIHDANQPLMRSVPKYVGVERIDDSALVLKFVVDVSEVDIYAGMRALNRDLLLGMNKLGVNVPYQRIDMRG